MGFESFNAEPVVPDESERVDDVAKAEDEARLIDMSRELHNDPKVAEEVAYSNQRIRNTALLSRQEATGVKPLPETGWYDSGAGGQFETDEAKKQYKKEEAEKLDQMADKGEWATQSDIENRNK